MATEFKLPDLGENIEGGDVVSVLVSEGDTIEAEQGVIEVETDKAMVEVPCSQAGKVTRIHVKEGQEIKVGDVILTLDDAAGEEEASGGEEQEEPKKESAQVKKGQGKAEKKKAAAAEDDEETRPTKKQKEKAKAALAGEEEGEPGEPGGEEEETGGKKAKSAAAKSRPADEEPEAEEESGEEEEPPAPPSRLAPSTGSDQAAPPADHAVAAAPATRRLARELGVSLEKVKGTGDGGRVTREDIINAVRQSAAPAKARPAPSPAARPVELPGEPDEDQWGTIHRDRLPKIRKVIAATMAKSASTIPHVTNFDDADVTKLESFRQTAKEDYETEGLRLTMMPLVIRAVALSLRRHPRLNASIDLEQGHVVYKGYINIGVAIDSERGLVAPNIRNADRLTVAQIARELAGLVQKIRSNKFTPDDLRGGTFTISNLGAIGGTYSTPIINPPEVAILLLGRTRKLPVVIEDPQGDRVESRLMMPLSLSYDHRLVDGADAARFLNDLKSFLETPSRLLMAP